MKELSFIVPVYNVEDYLEECLDSLLKVQNIDYEIVIINDGSKDNSLNIAKKYKDEHDEVIRIISQENQGLSVARNAGIDNAYGEYLVFIDSDDYIIPENFTKFWEKFQKADKEIAIANYVKLQKGVLRQHNYNYMKKRAVKKENMSGIEYMRYMYDYLGDRYDTETVTQIYKTAFLNDNHIRFKPGIIHEDTLFMFEVFVEAQKIKVYDDVFYVYRMRDGSIMHSLGDNHYLSLKYIVEVFDEERTNKNIVNRFIDSYIISILYEISKMPSVYAEIYNASAIIKASKKLTLKSWIKKQRLILRGE